MKRSVTSSSLVAAALITSAPALAQTDDCANATAITGEGQFFFNLIDATRDGVADPSCRVGDGSGNIQNDVWYAWTADETLHVTISTCGWTGVDTKIAAYEGTTCPEGSGIVDCNDDTCGTQSSIDFDATQGTTYLIRIGMKPGTTPGAGFIDIEFEAGPGGGGADVIVGDLPNTSHYGAVGGIRAYAVGTTSCNVGDEDLLWISGNNKHPVIAQNMYRYNAGNFEMIGASWLKHGFTALTQNLCDTCNGHGGSVLGVGCSDPYSSGLNGQQSRLGPRFQVNATNGVFAYPFANPNGSTGNAIFKRLQVEDSKLGISGARYFVEGHYITQDDAQAGNGLNNASYREVNVNGSRSLSLVGGTVREQPAIFAWKAIDSEVDLQPADYDDGGLTARFWVGSRVTDNGDGTWDYQYNVFNLNADRSAGSVSIEAPASVNVSGLEFNDVTYHSGEPYSGTDWAGSHTGGSVTWATETEAQNVNANALRWSTMYSYRFTADSPPTSGTVTIGLFKAGGAGDVDEVTVTTSVPEGAPCLADWNGDNSVLSNDFLDYLNDYNTVLGGGSPTYGDPDLAAPFGSINTQDLLAFLNLWSDGCP